VPAQRPDSNIEEDEEDPYSFFPDNYEDDEIKAIKKRIPVPMNTWIVKPGENSNRGFGINVAHEISEIRSLISGSRGPENTHII